MGQDESSMSVGGPPKTLSERSLSAVADYIKTGRDKRIVVLTGAGISTAAGIPDFRSPKTGLYANLARLNLPYAEAVFDISYFRDHPEPFYVLANELYPGKFHPTVSHVFITLLARKGLLQMLFTQNIDCLERVAGVPSDKIIEAHGSFATQRCIECKTEFPDDKMKDHVFGGMVPQCDEPGCNGLVKPDIVFFGESLPKAFDNNTYQVAMADLVLVIGTSLSVYPFAALPGMAQEGKPRVLFNMERVGLLGNRSDDVMELGACDDGIRKLADELGWRDELEQLWRDTVGDEEADRQLSGREKNEVEDEVERLAAEIGAVVIDDDKDVVEADVKGDVEADAQGAAKADSKDDVETDVKDNVQEDAKEDATLVETSAKQEEKHNEQKVEEDTTKQEPIITTPTEAKEQLKTEESKVEAAETDLPIPELAKQDIPKKDLGKDETVPREPAVQAAALAKEETK
ncbi:hypothetical protein FZEAL_2028 [Fusarium zealandicum]|uniref:Deacetylase sirtuin-type domain-containing protein n=1 Tax=Fusarium zealandicum TaxID=1053134 RepID=A0A8H4URP4_9HYPO|nr:hypothetical protein FZEAL_2028 [Fusarium zealandicum]